MQPKPMIDGPNNVCLRNKRRPWPRSLDIVRALSKSQIVHFLGSRRNPTVFKTLNWLSSFEISRRIAVRRRLAYDLGRRKFLAQRFQRALDRLDDRTLDRAGALWFRPDPEIEHHCASGDIVDEHCWRR